MKKAFTILMLVMAIAIVGTLAFFALSIVNNVREKAKNAKVQTEMDSLNKAVYAYYLDNNAPPINPNRQLSIGDPDFPTKKNLACNIGESTFVSGVEKICLGELVPDYIKVLPSQIAHRRFQYSDYYTGVTFDNYTLYGELKPQAYGPFNRGWNCSVAEAVPDASGYVPKLYCLGFSK